ncbi:MAG: hypothetical protein LBT00_08935 [Spirochaetaceae bacterium]|nr:hypothetical protein [Spirochaetaceae bacterium]
MSEKSLLAISSKTTLALRLLIPCLRGMIFGYIAEYKFQSLILNNPLVTSSYKDDDHDRSKKGDRRIVYKGKEFIIEVKSLQTRLVKSFDNDRWEGKTNVDGSDRRIVHFPDGTELNTRARSKTPRGFFLTVIRGRYGGGKPPLKGVA